MTPQLVAYPNYSCRRRRSILPQTHDQRAAFLGIRNPRAHNLHDNDPRVVDEMLELFAFASFLFRQLDRAQSDQVPQLAE